MAEFELKNNYLGYNGQFKHQILGTAIAAKFVPTYACITFCGAWKVSRYLVRAKLYTLKWTVGSCNYNNKCCEVCENVTETSTFTSSVTESIYIINHQLNCSEKRLVYLLSCNKCLKLYLGQTVDEFCRERSNHKSNDRKFQRYERCLQEHLF